ncbi:hypothetical protein [Parafrankia discariae]|uniref:hypothetical protein n=1 Tax=Parafrankia discariae TaxID=365528 RepID=UPI0003A2F0E7|nr:hypothetical protein [Parafrankia discariae]
MAQGDHIWIFGFATVTLVARTVGTPAVRRRFGDAAAQTFERRTGTAIIGAFTVWLAVFWGLTYAASSAAALLASFLVEHYRRQRARGEKPDTTDAHPEAGPPPPTVDHSHSTSA